MIHLRLRPASALLALGLCLVACPPLPSRAGSLRAAAAKVDITPDTPQQMRGYGPRLSSGVHLPIHHRVLALDDGRRRMIVASTEVCLIRPTDYDRVAALVERTYGIPPLDFLWTVTHTHSAPELGAAEIGRIYMPERHVHEPDEEYARATIEKLIAAIGEALAALEPARLGVGWGRAEANINRRERRDDGKIHLGKNPDGPIDRKIGVIHLLRRDRDEAIATLANYAIHATALGSRNLLVSGDAPGVAAAHVEASTRAPLLFVNGAAGNIAPLHSGLPTPEEGQLDEFGPLLGGGILDAIAAIRAYRDAPVLHPGEVVFESPRKEGMGWPETWGAYARDGDDGRPLVRMPCRFLRIDGDIMIWTAPVELFCEISNEIRAASPFPYTFFYGYANGWFGYLPTEAAFAEGGYEPRVTPFTPVAAAALIQLVNETIREQAPRPPRVKATSPIPP